MVYFKYPAITAAKISANAIGANEIAAGAITTNKIAANQITGGLIASSGIITSAAQINDGVITNAKIQDAAITNAKIGSLDASKITAGTISADRFIGAGIASSQTTSHSYYYGGSSQIYNQTVFSTTFTGLTNGSAILLGVSTTCSPTSSTSNNPAQVTLTLNINGTTSTHGFGLITKLKTFTLSGTSVTVSMTATFARRFQVNGDSFFIGIIQ